MKHLLFLITLLSGCCLQALAYDSDENSGQEQSAVETTDTIEGKTFEEVELVQQTVKHEAHRDIFTVTKAMREGTTTAGELIGQVQGAFYNRATEAVSYMGSTNIKILVDSIDKDDNYIKRLNPARFSRIDVIHNPAGKYQQYDYIGIVFRRIRIAPRWPDRAICGAQLRKLEIKQLGIKSVLPESD